MITRLHLLRSATAALLGRPASRIGQLVSTQPDLDTRVAALEQRLATVGASEATLPTYLIVDPNTGQVTAQFTGSVLLNEAAGSTFVATHAIAWQDALTVIREYVQGYVQGISHLLVASSDADATDHAQLVLTSTDSGVDSVAALNLTDSAGGFFAPTVGDSNKRSSFAQIPSITKAIASWGIFTGSGTIAGGSGNFTVTRIGTGQYQIVVAGAVGLLGTASAAQGGTYGFLTCSQIATDTIEVDFVNSLGVATDTNISFVAWNG